MRPIFYCYCKALLRFPPYIVILAASGAILPLVPHGITPSVSFSLFFLTLAVILFRLIHPCWMLRANDFLRTLPFARERLALAGFCALGVPLFPFLLAVFGLSPFCLLYSLSTLLICFLSVGSSLSLPFLVLLPLCFLSQQATLTEQALLLFGVPHLINLALRLARRTQGFTFFGFLYRPRYTILSATVLLFFDVCVARKHAMRFVIAGGITGFHYPEFSSFFLVFLILSFIFLMLPFLNLIGLRGADSFLTNVRLLVATPSARRVWTLIMALLLNLPVVLFMKALSFVQTDFFSLANLGIAGAWVNAMLITEENSTWAAYAAMLYLLLAHTVTTISPFLLLGISLIGTILLYDVDKMASFLEQPGRAFPRLLKRRCRRPVPQ